MGEFFEPLPPPEPRREQRFRAPAWQTPPMWSLPGTVAGLILARTEHIAICIKALSAYQSGFAIDLLVLCDEPVELDPFLMQPPHRRMRLDAADTESQQLRFGIEFADGRKATNGGHRLDLPELDANGKPTAPVMRPHGGSGGGGRFSHQLWVWPLPPPGPLSLVCEWQAAGIPLTRRELDAQVLLDAAARSQVVFDEDRLPERER